LGAEAVRFVDWLGECGQSFWQVLPLGPTSFGDSPYLSLSTFAGNQLLISFDLLVEQGLLAEERLADIPAGDPHAIEFGDLIQRRMDVLSSVCRSFASRADSSLKASFEAFCEENAGWLDDYAIFVALKNLHGGRPWIEWKSAYRDREENALRRIHRSQSGEIRDVKILQFLFADHWRRLRDHCRQVGVSLIGDLPIFVAHDSADVWANRELFLLDEDGQPTVVGGVPPDYFSETGQRWGNPLYRWDRHAESGYAWWVRRLRWILGQVDVVRIDHFRGFEAYWEIPAKESTAVGGRWVPGPGEEIFQVLEESLGKLPIIAEDLGFITEGVNTLRDRFEFPGMRVLQFAFESDPGSQDFQPGHFPDRCVAYTGTHDNDTMLGWFRTESGKGDDRRRSAILEVVGGDASEIHWGAARAVAGSPAGWVVFPLQDILGLGSEARMNVPGIATGNWRWRFSWDQLTSDCSRNLLEMTRETGRLSRTPLENLMIS
jgi:4-alpha-glucanotransferase